MFITLWSTVLFATVIVLGRCGPLSQGSPSDRVTEVGTTTTESLITEKDGASGNGETTPNGVYTQEVTAVNETEGTAPGTPKVKRLMENESEGLGVYDDKPQPTDEKPVFGKEVALAEERNDTDESDDSDDDDSEDDAGETSKKIWNYFMYLDGKAKRETDSEMDSVNAEKEGEDGAAEGENEMEDDDGEMMEGTADDFGPYAVASDDSWPGEPEMKDGSDGSPNLGIPVPSQNGRERRQSGEAIPYRIPNRSRRDLPAYPAYLANANEHTVPPPAPA